MMSAQATSWTQPGSNRFAMSRLPLSRALVIPITLLALAGCPASAEDVRPPADEFFFPTGLAATPDESTVFVINANANLRYASGGVLAIDVDRVDSTVDGWVNGGDIAAGCDADSVLPFLINCDEEDLIRDNGSVRLSSFSTQIGVQELAGGDVRLFVASRGDPSITFVDYSVEGGLDCGGSGSQPVCDDEHRLTQLRDDSDIGRLIEEPFGVFVDSVREYLMVTHLTSGSVTLLDAPSDGTSPVISDVITGIFASGPRGSGAVGVAGRRPGDQQDLVYVTSRTDSRIQLLSVARPANDGLPRIATADFFFLDQVRPADDSRDIAFGAGGDRAYVVNREPPLLHILDTSEGVDGKPSNQFIGGVELCAEVSNLTVLDAGRGERVYVSCFRDSQVWAIDPIGRTVEAVIDVGRGPNSLVGLPGRGKVLVSNFLEDTISVIDVTPGSPFENRFVMRLGRARQGEE